MSSKEHEERIGRVKGLPNVTFIEGKCDAWFTIIEKCTND